MPNFKLAYLLITVVWLGEIPTFIRRRPEAKRSDRGSILLFYLVLAPAFSLAFSLWGATRGTALSGLYDFFSFGSWIDSAAVAMMLAGTAVRLWSVKTLGGFFTRVVRVSPDQPVISEGPYRLLRHPSYAGGGAALLGTALTLHNWLSFSIVAVALAFCYGYRIRVEERALAVTLGRPYRDYMSRTKRIIPFVW